MNTPTSGLGVSGELSFEKPGNLQFAGYPFGQTGEGIELEFGHAMAASRLVDTVQTGISQLTQSITSQRDRLVPFVMREATVADVPALVDIDMVAFRSVYAHYGMGEDELAADLINKFYGRMEILGDGWTEILFSRDERPLGFIMACPTSESPEDFVSWEHTTRNGTLDGTYDEDGNFLYVVSLSVLPEASNAGGQDMLMMNMIGNIVKGDYHAYFESRLPGLKRWMMSRCRENGLKLDALNQEERDGFAEQYFESRIEIDGKKVPTDRLMRMYESMGCSFVKLAPDAYQDELSMNYGVVCQYDNPLPDWVRRSAIARGVIGSAIRVASHSPDLIERLG
jgi:hypothetical protein